MSRKASDMLMNAEFDEVCCEARSYVTTRKSATSLTELRKTLIAKSNPVLPDRDVSASYDTIVTRSD